MIDEDDDDDFEISEDDGFEEEVVEKNQQKIKRDFRTAIERKLELLELRKLTGDFYDEEIFN